MSDLFAKHELMPKYLVQKDGLILDPHTYFVVRSSDVFAPAGLRGYAANILTALELGPALDREFLDDNERAQLQDLAETINGIANAWEQGSQKIPD